MTRKGDPDRVEDADIEIGASVKAKRLRFRERPKTKVEPGITYRDVRVRWRAAVRLDLRDPDRRH